MTTSERRMKIMDIVNDIAMNANNASYVKVRAEDLIADLFCDCISDGVMAMFHIVNGVPVYTLNTEFGSYTVPSTVVNDKLARLTTQHNKAIPASVDNDEKKKIVNEAEYPASPESDNVTKHTEAMQSDNGDGELGSSDNASDERIYGTEPSNDELNSQANVGNYNSTDETLNIQDEGKLHLEETEGSPTRESNSRVEENDTESITNTEMDDKEAVISSITESISDILTSSEGEQTNIKDNVVNDNNAVTVEEKGAEAASDNAAGAFQEAKEDINLEEQIAASIEEEMKSVGSSEIEARINRNLEAEQLYEDVKEKKPDFIAQDEREETDKAEGTTEQDGEAEQQIKHHFGLLSGFGKIKHRDNVTENNKSKFAALDEDSNLQSKNNDVFAFPDDHGTMFKHTHDIVITMKYNQSAVIGKYKVEFWPTWVQFGMTNQTFAECLVRISDTAGTEEISIIDRRNHEFSYKFPNTDYTFKMVGVWNSGMLTTSVSIDNDSKYLMRDTLTREEPEKLDGGFLEQFEYVAKGQPKYTILPLRNDNRGEENIPIIGIAEDNNSKILLRRMKGNTCQYTHNNRTRVITGHWENGKFCISID